MAAEAKQMATDLINQTEAVKDSNFEEDFIADLKENEEETELHEIEAQKEDLKTHTRIKKNICGTIIDMEQGYAKTTLQTTNEMIADEFGLIHSGFIFSAADYAAAVAVNEENVVIIGAKTKFLAPAKLNDLIEFEAHAKFEDSRKREIKVEGYLNDIRIFEGIFQAVVLENHILKTKIKHLHRNTD
jgi:acyl-coenzyme A thioesterase PaaI-like protein